MIPNVFWLNIGQTIGRLMEKKKKKCLKKALTFEFKNVQINLIQYMRPCKDLLTFHVRIFLCAAAFSF